MAMTDERRYDAQSLPGFSDEIAPQFFAKEHSLNSPLNQLGSALVQSTGSDQFLTLAEGYLKVVCVKAALSLGWKLQEGARNKYVRGGGKEDIADYLWLLDGVLKNKRGVRAIAIANGSTDITVVEPQKLFLELKTRPDFGAKSLAQFEEMSEDIKRISSMRECAFLFVFDEQLYRSFSGEKETYAGRPPSKCSVWFHKSFPRIKSLSPSSPMSIGCQFGDRTIQMTFWVQKLPNGKLRILCMGARRDSDWHLSGVTEQAASTLSHSAVHSPPLNLSASALNLEV